jgi:hypothetical protein
MIRPFAIPATCPFTGTPAAIKAKEPTQADAIDDEPLDSKISDTILIVYGNSSTSGIMYSNARSANAP